MNLLALPYHPVPQITPALFRPSFARGCVIIATFKGQKPLMYKWRNRNPRIYNTVSSIFRGFSRSARQAQINQEESPRFAVHVSQPFIRARRWRPRAVRVKIGCKSGEANQSEQSPTKKYEPTHSNEVFSSRYAELRTKPKKRVMLDLNWANTRSRCLAADQGYVSCTRIRADKMQSQVSVTQSTDETNTQAW